jgi:hypothetical protein
VVLRGKGGHACAGGPWKQAGWRACCGSQQPRGACVAQAAVREALRQTLPRAAVVGPTNAPAESTQQFRPLSRWSLALARLVCVCSMCQRHAVRVPPRVSSSRHPPARVRAVCPRRADALPPFFLHTTNQLRNRPPGIVLTNDGHAILREIDVNHPAAKVGGVRTRASEEGGALCA